MATTSKTAAGEAPRATSVATRRRHHLLLREPRRLRPRLSVFEIASRDQLGELLDARRGFRGQRLGLPRQGNHGAPESAFDDDRRADRRANAYAPRARAAIGPDASV